MQKCSILDIWLGSEYASVKICTTLFLNDGNCQFQVKKKSNTRTINAVLFSKSAINTRAYFTHCSCVSCFIFEQVNTSWVGFYLGRFNHYKQVLGEKKSKLDRKPGAVTFICKKLFFYAKSNQTQNFFIIIEKHKKDLLFSKIIHMQLASFLNNQLPHTNSWHLLVQSKQ